MSETNIEAGLDIIKQALDQGDFDSLNDWQLADFRRRCLNSPDAHYHTVMSESGEQAADAWLLKRHSEFHPPAVADAIPAIAQSMIALVATGDPSLRIKRFGIEDRGYGMFPGFDSPSGVDTAAGLVVFNAQQRNHDNYKPLSGGTVFGPYGVLEPIAFCVTADTLQPGKNSVSMLFPRKKIGEYDEAYGYSYLTFHRDGNIRCGGRGIGMAWRREVDVALDFAFTGELDYRVSARMGGSVEDTLGFPGAEDYLLKYIDQLSLYLSGLAENLAATASSERSR